MKKFKVWIAALAVMLIAVFCLSACGGNYSETFTGKLSDEKYATSDLAVHEFLKQEYSGKTSSVSFVSCETKKSLTEEEIAELDLGEEAERVQSVEQVEVKYNVGTTSGTAADDSMPEAYITLCYVVKIADTEKDDSYYYRYFVPASGTGEMISKSYYDDVTNAENYKNCTEVIKMSMKVKVLFLSVKQEIKYTLKLTEDVVYMKVTSGSDGFSQTGDYYYIDSAQYGNVLQFYRHNENDNWSVVKMANIRSLSELYSQQELKFCDHTYFEKTKNGFRLADEKFLLYANKYIDTAELGKDMSMTCTGGEASYFVTEGRLSKSTVKLNVTGTATAEGTTMNYKGTASGVSEFSEFGTTTVTISDDLQAFMQKYL